MLSTPINPHLYNKLAIKIRNFFHKEGLIEAYYGNVLNVLAACEDVKNLATFTFANTLFPQVQTSQMNLEATILEDNSDYGFFSFATSFREEKNIVPGRHDMVFLLFEFEIPGDMNELIAFEKRFLKHLGFKDEWFTEVNYMDMCEKYGVSELTHEHEQRMCEDFTPVVFLKYFPAEESFWNMKRCDHDKKLVSKIDVIIKGQESIGSAERSCNRDEMRDAFHQTSDGEYAGNLYKLFGEDRVEKELDEYLAHNFKVRSGAGIGSTRLIRGMKLLGLL